MVNIIVTFPINKLMFRQQLYGTTTAKALKQLTREGALTLYRGLLPPLIQKSTSVSIMFGIFHHFDALFKENYQLASTNSTIMAAVIAGSIETSLTPFERIQTLLQDPRHHSSFRNTKHAFVRVGTQHGLIELFRGATPILYRNTTSSALFFCLRDPLRCRLQSLGGDKENKLVRLAHNFLSGAAIGGMCSTAVYPINVVKTRMQSKLGGTMESFSRTFVIVYRERGLGIYRGIHLNLIRSVLSWGIINAAYESLLRLF